MGSGSFEDIVEQDKNLYIGVYITLFVYLLHILVTKELLKIKALALFLNSCFTKYGKYVCCPFQDIIFKFTYLCYKTLETNLIFFLIPSMQYIGQRTKLAVHYISMTSGAILFHIASDIKTPMLRAT